MQHASTIVDLGSRHDDTLSGGRPAVFAGDAPESSWFGCDSRAVFLLDFDGSILSANPAAGRLHSSGRFALPVPERLAFNLPLTDARFRRALATAASGRADRQTIVLRGNDGAWRRVEIARLRGEGQRAFLAVHGERDETQLIAPVVDAFGLTPTEAEVLKRLVTDSAPKEIARSLSMSTHTVRTHLRNIYAKMGVRGMTCALRLASELTT